MPPLNEQTALERATAEKAAENAGPRVQSKSVLLAALAAKASATVSVGVSDVAGTVTDVEYIPNTPVVQSATEPRTITVINRGSAGVGSAVVATRSFTSTGSGQIQNKITLTGSAVTVVPGDVLLVESHDAGATGTADPGGHVKVVLTRTTKVASASGTSVGNPETGVFGTPTLGA